MSRIANKYLSFALGAAAFFVANGWLLGTQALAADDGAAARIEAVTGLVSVTQASGVAGIAGAGHALRRGDTVHTERNSTARVRFSDASEVVLRQNSQVRVDDYAFDPARPQSDNFALRLLKGGLRSITGAIAKRNRDRVSYNTTTATIGIRGTDFMMRLCDDDCAREEMTAGGLRLPDAAVARVGAISGGVSALRPDGRWRALDAGDAVYSDDAIVTGARGVAVLFFVDDTRITLQPRSILVVEDYAYDAAAPALGGAVLVLLDGAARTQTGAIAKANAERFVFLTPERRIRVHGTLFDTVVAVVAGAAENAGEQAEQAAQQAQDAANKAAAKAADAAQQGVEAAKKADDVAKIAAGQAVDAAKQRLDVVVNKSAKSVPRLLPGPQWEWEVNWSPVQVTRDGGKVGVRQDYEVTVNGQTRSATVSAEVGEVGVAAGKASEIWHEVIGIGAGRTGEARETTTRTTRRVVTWGGGKISGAVDGVVAAGKSGAAAAGRTVDYVYDAVGRVVAVGRGVAETGSAATHDAIWVAATATDRAIAVVIPAIIGKGSGTVREETGGGKGPPPPSGGTSQGGGDNARQVTAATSAERRAAAVSASDKNAPGAPPQIARFSGETAGQSPAEPEGKGSGGTAGEEDLGGSRSPSPKSGGTSQGSGDNARQVTAATSAERRAAAAGSASDMNAAGAPPQIARFSSETAGRKPAEPEGKGSGATAGGDLGVSKAPPPPSGGTSQGSGDNARRITAMTSAERAAGGAVGSGGGMSVTAVQVHDGAVTIAGASGETAVRRGTLAVATGGGATTVRFDGVIPNTSPNPGRFKVSGPLFGATTGDSPAAGLYTLVFSGQISMTQAGQDIRLGPGEAGYADDKGGAPVRLRDIPNFLDDDRHLATAIDTSLMMCRLANGRTGAPQMRASSVRGAEVSAAIVAAAASASAGSRGLPGSSTAPSDNAGYRDLVGAENYAATRSMSGAERAKYWGGLDAGDFAARVQVAGQSSGAGMSGDGFGVRGVGPTSGSFGEPAGGFSGGNSPGRGAAASVRDSGKWIGGQRYGGTFGADRAGLTRSGDIAIGAGDGMGNFRGGGRGNAASGGGGLDPLNPTNKNPSEPGAIVFPYPDAGGGAPDKPTSTIPKSSGNEAGTSGGAASAIAMQNAASGIFGMQNVKYKTRRERDDELGGSGAIVVLNRADAGQMANAIRRWIGAITGAAGGAGDGRTDQQSTTGGGPMMMDRGAQADAKRGGGAAGTLNQDVVFRINQLVNPGAQ